MLESPSKFNKKKTLRVLVVDDHLVARQGLKLLINTEDNLEVCGEAGSVSEALLEIEKVQPDIVVSDLSLPDRSGIELIRDACALHPKLKFLVVSIHDETLYAERILRAGGKGYIMKDADAEELSNALQAVAVGDVYVSSKMASHMIKVFSSSKDDDAGHSILNSLTDRELQVFELIGQGEANQAIASHLGITARTVDAHKTKIKNKLDLDDMNSLFRQAVKWTELKVKGGNL